MNGNPGRGLDARSLEVLEAIVERLIPTDDAGPGAREAHVSRYIERALATEYVSLLETYEAALAAVDAHAQAAHGRGFSALDAEQQDAVLGDLEAQRVPGAPPACFDLIRQHAMEGMFGDPRWGGNADHIGWQLIGYPGPKAVWTAEEQQLDVPPL